MTTNLMKRWFSRATLVFEALLYIILTCHCARAITYQHDELLYTKQLWNEFKLKFPHSALKTGDLTRKSGQLDLDDLFVEHSLAAQRISYHNKDQEISHSGTKTSISKITRVDTLLLSDDIPAFGATSASQEAACSLLLDELWKDLVEYTISMGKVRYLLSDDKNAVHDFVDQLCETRIPVALLKKNILVVLRVVTKDRGRGESVEHFYMLLPRHKQHAKPAEIASVREACRLVLKPNVGDDSSFESSMSGENVTTVAIELQNQLADAIEDAVNRVQRVGKEIQGGSATADALNLELQSRQSCLDRHPQCELWASKGECTANAMYMVGDDSPSDAGWCRRACKKCIPPEKHSLHEVWPRLSASDIEVINDTSRQLLEEFQGRVCPEDLAREYAAKHAFLRDALGFDVDDGIDIDIDIDDSKPLILQQARGVAGPVVVSKAPPVKVAVAAASNLDPQLLQRSVVVTVKSITESIGERRSSSQFAPEKIPEQQQPEETSDIQQLLDKELGEKCLYTVGSWWNYEVCYKSAVTQFHVDAASGMQNADWVISLGVFKNADWRVREANDAALYAPGTVVPYISHEAVEGGDCVITGEAGVDSLSDPPKAIPGTFQGTLGGALGETVQRSTHIRYMCSPDALSHVVVRESIQCRYAVDVYLPSLCDVSSMTVNGQQSSSAFQVSIQDGSNAQELDDGPVAIFVTLDKGDVEENAIEEDEEGDENELLDSIASHDEL
jgi:hypothetical protein